MKKTISIIVRGKVQGVYFRQSTRERALALGVVGTVCNKQDGSVKIVVTGTPDQLAAFVEWCSTGPPHAVVENILQEELPEQAFTGFRIER